MTRARRGLSAAIAALAFLAGCAGLERPGVPVGRGASGDSAPIMLEYYRRLRSLPVADLERERRRLAEELAVAATLERRLRVALAHLIPSGTPADAAALAGILEASTPGPQELSDLRLLLADVLAQSLALRVERDESSAAVRQRDLELRRLKKEVGEARGAATQLQARLAAVETALAAEQDRAEHLQEQLDELRNIERSLEARPRPPAPEANGAAPAAGPAVPGGASGDGSAP